MPEELPLQTNRTKLLMFSCYKYNPMQDASDIINLALSLANIMSNVCINVPFWFGWSPFVRTRNMTAWKVLSYYLQTLWVSSRVVPTRFLMLSGMLRSWRGKLYNVIVYRFHTLLLNIVDAAVGIWFLLNQRQGIHFCLC